MTRASVHHPILLRLLAAGCVVALSVVPSLVAAQGAVIIRGGWIFTATSDTVEHNRGILVRSGKLMVVDGRMAEEDTSDARIVQLTDDEYVIPGIFDMHAHYNMTLGEGGVRADEFNNNPLIFLANGVTSTFPGGRVRSWRGDGHA